MSDEVFAFYRSLYDYVPLNLDARTEEVDESGRHWRRETVSFTAAYGDERVIAHLFLPLNSAPPYQAVVYVPGSPANMHSSIEDMASDPASSTPKRACPRMAGISGNAGEGGWEAPILLGSSPSGSDRPEGQRPAADDRLSPDPRRHRQPQLAYSGQRRQRVRPSVQAIEHRFKVIAFLAGGFDDIHMLAEPPNQPLELHAASDGTHDHGQWRQRLWSAGRHCPKADVRSPGHPPNTSATFCWRAATFPTTSTP